MTHTTTHEPDATARPLPPRLRTIAFTVVLGVLSFGLLVPEGWTLTLPVVVWLPDAVANDILAPWVDDASIHRVHLMAKGLAHVLVTTSLLVQWRHPTQRQAPMWLASMFFLMALTVNLITGSTSDDVPPVIWIIFGLGISAGALHPASPIRRLPTPVDRRLLALTGLMAVPVAIHATQQLALQINGGAGDPHWTAVHYIFSAEIGILIILAAFVSTSDLTGRRLIAWMTAFAAVSMGLASAVYADQASSLGVGWGLSLVAWGIAFIVLAEAGRRREHDRAAPPERAATTPARTASGTRR